MLRSKKLGPLEVVYGRNRTRHGEQSATLMLNGYGVEMYRAGAVFAKAGYVPVAHIAIGDPMRFAAPEDRHITPSVAFDHLMPRWANRLRGLS